MKRWAAPAAIGTVFAGALFINLGAPFLRHRETVCAAYGTMARNHVRLGFSQTRLGLYEVSSPDVSVYGEWRHYVYPNRPPLSVATTGVWFMAFGDSEAVLRLSLIAVALATLAAFAFLARRLLPEPWSWIAVSAFAFNPMFWYFSVVAVHLAYALAFSTAAWACRVRWEDGRRFRILTIVFLLLACLSDWPGYFAVFSIALDALLMRRRRIASGFLALGVACFGLHLLHLWWLDPTGGTMLRFFHAGAERSVDGIPGPGAYLLSEAREAGLYFTVGGLFAAAAAVRRLPRRVWLLAFLGLEEIVFARLAYNHDFLSLPLVPFFALAVARGVQTLWETPARRKGAIVLLALAGLQSLWITGDRLIRRGALEANYLAGRVIRETTRPQERVLVTIADVRQFTPYYADRYTAGVEAGQNRLVVHHSAGGMPVRDVEDLGRFAGSYDYVLVGDPARAAREIAFFKGQPPPAAFNFLETAHPLRKALEASCVAKVERGPFILYRMR